MKRFDNLYESIYSIENLQLADQIASKGKSKQHGVIIHNKNREADILSIHRSLKDKTYSTSAYTTFTIYEPKEREIFRLPYFPDRIVHHAVMNILEPIFVSSFTADTYSCIKGRGTHAASEALKLALKDVPGTKYCLKLDVKKFYPTIDHDILKRLLLRKFKDGNLLWLLFEIIDSAAGLPIGNYLSQYLANFYVSGLDHWLKEEKGVENLFRYADDIVIPMDNKPDLHQLLSDIREYLFTRLKLEVKGNYQIFPTKVRGIDFVGRVHFPDYTRLRKRTKQNFARMLATNRNRASIASYSGLAKHCNCKHLLKKLLYDKGI